MFLFLDVSISTIYLSIRHGYPLVVIVTLHLGRGGMWLSSGLRRARG